jgi:hypothetical protein
MSILVICLHDRGKPHHRLGQRDPKTDLTKNRFRLTLTNWCRLKLTKRQELNKPRPFVVCLKVNKQIEDF